MDIVPKTIKDGLKWKRKTIKWIEIKLLINKNNFVYQKTSIHNSNNSKGNITQCAKKEDNHKVSLLKKL